jgi:hypothetical protein
MSCYPITLRASPTLTRWKEQLIEPKENKEYERGYYETGSDWPDSKE